jgi:tRNA A37 threonylcarbamoyladenosine dehydratase
MSDGLRRALPFAAGALAYVFLEWWVRARQDANAVERAAVPTPDDPDVPRVLWPAARDAEAATLLAEQLSRGSAFAGAAAHEQLCGSLVVVIGLESGVGGHVAHMLARAGVRRLRLVGGSRVTRASLAVDAIAVATDLGAPSGAVLRAQLVRIVPDVRIEFLADEWTADDAAAEATEGGAAARALGAAALEGDIALVVDCLEAPAAKAALLRACEARGVRALTIGLVRGRCDLTRWHAQPLASGALADPLLNATHRRLERGAAPRVLALYSSEPLAQTVGAADVAAAAERAPVIAGAGQMAALCAIQLLVQERPAGAAGPLAAAGRLGRALRARLHARLCAREAAMHGASSRETARALPLDELELACASGWAMRCALSREPLDSRALNLELVRARADAPLSVGNVLLLRADLAAEHEAAGAHAAAAWSAADRARIERTCALLAQ